MFGLIASTWSRRIVGWPTFDNDSTVCTTVAQSSASGRLTAVTRDRNHWVQWAARVQSDTTTAHSWANIAKGFQYACTTTTGASVWRCLFVCSASLNTFAHVIRLFSMHLPMHLKPKVGQMAHVWIVCQSMHSKMRFVLIHPVPGQWTRFRKE